MKLTKLTAILFSLFIAGGVYSLIRAKHPNSSEENDLGKFIRIEPEVSKIEDHKTVLVTSKLHTIDLGLVRPAETKRFSVTIKNDTSETLAIEQLTSSCGCITATYAGKQILPGQETPILIELRAESKEHKIEKVVRIIFRNSKIDRLILALTGELRDEISTPSDIIRIDDVYAGEKKSFYLNFGNSTASAWEEVEVISSADWLKVKSTKKSDDLQWDKCLEVWRTEIEITASKTAMDSPVLGSLLIKPKGLNIEKRIRLECLPKSKLELSRNKMFLFQKNQQFERIRVVYKNPFSKVNELTINFSKELMDVEVKRMDANQWELLIRLKEIPKIELPHLKKELPLEIDLLVSIKSEEVAVEEAILKCFLKWEK